MSAEESDLPVRPGDIVAGKYRIVRLLGVGGMGAVVEAIHLELNQSVALKFLSPAMRSNEQAVMRFKREAQAAARIQSEHVVRVMDVGTHQGGVPYLVMECLRGTAFDDILEQVGSLGVTVAVDYVLQACEAVVEAHAAGIVHRDLKPGNLFLTERKDGSKVVKVLDFGISKLVATDGEANHGITATSAVLGSPLYTSPEQMLSAKQIDGRVDVWALGVILYECLSGRSPFSAETLPELYVRIATADPEPLRTVRPDVPPALEAVVLRCLEKKPADRFRHVGDLADALAAFASEEGRRAVPRIRRIAGHLPASVLVCEPSQTAAKRRGPGTGTEIGPGGPARRSRGSEQPAGSGQREASAEAGASGSSETEAGPPAATMPGVPLVAEPEVVPTDVIVTGELEKTQGLPEASLGVIAGASERASWPGLDAQSARQTAAAWGQTGADTARPNRAALWAIVGVVALLGTVGAVALSFRGLFADDGAASPDGAVAGTTEEPAVVHARDDEGADPQGGRGAGGAGEGSAGDAGVAETGPAASSSREEAFSSASATSRVEAQGDSNATGPTGDGESGVATAPMPTGKGRTRLPVGTAPSKAGAVPDYGGRE